MTSRLSGEISVLLLVVQATRQLRPAPRGRPARQKKPRDERDDGRDGQNLEQGEGAISVARQSVAKALSWAVLAEK